MHNSWSLASNQTHRNVSAYRVASSSVSAWRAANRAIITIQMTSWPLLFLARLQLITLSARASTLGGIVRPICFAAFRLMMNSNFFGCSTGKSAGLAVTLGLIASLARPGGNVTGLSSLSPELNSKRLEVLKDTVPKLARVGLLLPAGGSSVTERQIKELRAAAPALKLKLEEIETQVDPKDLGNAFETAKRKKVDAIMMISNRVFFAERNGSSTFPANSGCLRFTSRRSLLMRAASCPTG
jgi:putative tryptophan/tyrosine transport system substrate-binding protein